METFNKENAMDSKSLEKVSGGFLYTTEQGTVQVIDEITLNVVETCSTKQEALDFCELNDFIPFYVTEKQIANMRAGRRPWQD